MGLLRWNSEQGRRAIEAWEKIGKTLGAPPDDKETARKIGANFVNQPIPPNQRPRKIDPLTQLEDLALENARRVLNLPVKKIKKCKNP